MLVCAYVRGAFEHEVLEEVSEPCVARLFIFGADVIPNLEIDHRDAVVFQENYLQTVAERLRGEIEFRRARIG
jgi:hypothetical protein